MEGTGKVGLKEEGGEWEKQSLTSQPAAQVEADKLRLVGKSERISMAGCGVGCVGVVCGEFYGKATLRMLWVSNQVPRGGTLWDCCWLEGQAAGKLG